MYITSNGALTAGRVDADNCLFPYYTHDKLIDLESTTGSLTRIRVNNDHSKCWQPFSKERSQLDHIDRCLYKSLEGNEIIFEETHKTLGLRFSYLWTYSPKFGFVRQIELRNTGDQTAELQLLDGLHNLVPYGLDQGFLNRFSNLADAYKKSELINPEGIGVYYLSSIPSDRAEPSEGLKATVAWSLGYNPDHILLSDKQVESFGAGGSLFSEDETRGTRGAYLITKQLSLEPDESFTGQLVADINYDAGQVEHLRQAVRNPKALALALNEDIERGHRELKNKLAAADGYQLTRDNKRCARHLSNVLYNIMRGGIFFDNYQFPRDDFLHHLQAINLKVYASHGDALSELPERFDTRTLTKQAESSADEDLLRICIEYLPLTFSRRHGDPSRPWNAFSIETTNAKGDPILAYQGNWRDIFQNWEALAHSFPEFIEGMIFRFLNASTMDGYNPYRLTKDGFDWEILERDEPWSNIGYWGDHQIIYLLKLLEIAKAFNPGILRDTLDKSLFVFADVPYRIAGFDRLWENPQDTVDFDYAHQATIEERVSELGSDGKLVTTDSGTIVKTCLLDKLLVPLLTKMSNLVPEGGIWMNTQRPEWNDANNALVGNGLSVVTLGYLHRYLNFLADLFSTDDLSAEYEVTKGTATFLEALSNILSNHLDKLNRPLSDSERYIITKELGQAGSDYRNQVYDSERCDQKAILQLGQVRSFTHTAKKWIKRSLQANERTDGLYHSYNLLRKSDKEIAVDYLYEMLEGQVSILSAQLLTPEESVRLLDALKGSAIYREDKGSYMLYPNRQLPSFLEKNVITHASQKAQSLIDYLLENDRGKSVYQDVHGKLRFNGNFKNVGDLRQHIHSIKDSLLNDFTKEDFRELENTFIKTFNHQAFTGRSGTFFAYEGLGSIYWHMVSKLVLAIQEYYLEANGLNAAPDLLERLRNHYQETLQGLGIYQSPEEYGAFPSDAYSHTPADSGVQQPGMTGQVKEDILIRWAELGIQIDKGKISFQPKLLRRTEFLTTNGTFDHISVDGSKASLQLENGQLAFTYCQVPVLYRIAETSGLTIHTSNNEVHSLDSNTLPERFSRSVFSRSGDITLLEVNIVESWLQ